MFELDYDTKYLSVIIEFEYSREIPNDVRRAFMGLEKGSPNIPLRIKKLSNYEREIVYPIHFSLIKKPIKVDLPGTRNYRYKNTAVGATILYEYLGLPEDFKNCAMSLNNLLKDLKKKKTPKYFNSITKINIIIGYDLNDVSK